MRRTGEKLDQWWLDGFEEKVVCSTMYTFGMV